MKYLQSNHLWETPKSFASGLRKRSRATPKVFASGLESTLAINV